MWIEATTLGDLVDRAAARSTNTAVVLPDERLTYAELSALADRFARSFRALGVGPQDKVGILMPNCVDFIAALFGAAKLGAVVVPVNGRFRTHELGQIISHADVRLLVTAAGPAGTVDYPDLLLQVFDGIADQDPNDLRVDAAPVLRQIVDLGGSGESGFVTRADFEAKAGEVSDDDVRVLQQRVRVRDVALLMYTSGT